MKLKLVRNDLENEKSRQINTGAETVGELLKELEVPREEVLVARNGTIVATDADLEEGDTVKVLEVIAGG